MLIYCPEHLRNIYSEEDLYYNNRIINLDHVIIIGKSHVTRENGHSFSTIRFSHSKHHSTEWYFVHNEDRDKIFEEIIDTQTRVMNG